MLERWDLKSELDSFKMDIIFWIMVITTFQSTIIVTLLS